MFEAGRKLWPLIAKKSKFEPWRDYFSHYFNMSKPNITYWSVGWDHAGNLRPFAIIVETKEISPSRLRIGAESVYQAAERCNLTIVLPEPMIDVEMWAVNKYSEGGYFVMDNIIHAEEELGATKAI